MSSSTLAAISGYPHLTIPMGLVEGLPVGLSMVGLPGTEAQLLQLAQLLEQQLTALPLPSGITDVQ